MHIICVEYILRSFIVIFYLSSNTALKIFTHEGVIPSHKAKRALYLAALNYQFPIERAYYTKCIVQI